MVKIGKFILRSIRKTITLWLIENIDIINIYYHNQKMLRLVSRFGTNKNIQYGRYFLLEYKYVPDAYYKTVFSFSKHQNLLKKFEESQPVHIIGGQKFPMDGSYLIFNCEDENIPLKFVAEDPFLKDKTITDHKVTELTKQSKEKFNKLADFYSAY